MPSSQIGFPGYGIPSGSAATIVKNEVADYVALDEDFQGGVYLRMNVAVANKVTINTGMTLLLPLHVTQVGLGTTSIEAGVGVTIHSTDGWLNARTRFSNLTLIPLGADVYDLIGDLAE